MSDQELTAKVCEPCRGGIPPMERADAEAMLPRVPGWTIGGPPDQLERSFKLKDFQAAQDFAVAVGALAEEEGHHPDITYGWGYCTVRFYTHKIKGLHENDFIMAAKVDKLAEERGIGA